MDLSSEVTKMFAANEKYQNPPAPVGYVCQPKLKPVPVDDKIAYLSYMQNNMDFMFENEHLNEDLAHFRIMTSDEESSEEDDKKEEEVERSVKKEKTEECAAQKDVAVASTSKWVDLPQKTRQKSVEKSPKSKDRSRSVKKERRYSDSSSDSSHISSRKSRRHSPSPSPVKVKVEERVPDFLFGSYHCEVCNIHMNSLATYESHVSGKRHLKALKQKNIIDTVARSVPKTEVESKKPQPAHGVVRLKLRDRAFIQDVVDQKVINPCPGLDYVTEIRGFSETSYFCSLCNAPCSANSILPHLNGFKHQLKCLKHYRPQIYERNKYKQKYQIEDAVIDMLRDIVREEGTGRIAVEEERLARDQSYNEPGPSSASSRPGSSSVSSRPGSSSVSSRPGSSSVSSRPGTSSSHTELMDFQQYYEQTTVPDTSKSGYYCRTCESHMNSSEMWENHIRGKRHLTNARKMPGSLPSKIKTIPVKGARANLWDLLEDIDVPIVGLDHIRETQNHQTRKDMYQCYLCGACLNTSDIVDHLISQKHRVKYLQEVQDSCLDVVKDMDINGINAIAIVESVCANLEAKEGRGTPNVFFSKDFFPPV